MDVLTLIIVVALSLICVPIVIGLMAVGQLVRHFEERAAQEKAENKKKLLRDIKK